MKPKFLVMCVLLMAPTFAYQQTENRIYKDAISLGMGGVGVSTIGYQFSAMRNPANLGLMADHDLAPFLSLGVSINPEVIDLFKTIQPIASGEMGYENINYDALLNQAPTVGINGPINLGYMGKGFGFWTTSSIDGVAAIVPNNNPDTFFNKNGIDVNMNDLVKAGSEIEKSLSDGSITAGDAKDILQKYLGKDMTDKQLTELAQKFADEDATELLKQILPLANLSMTAEVAVNAGYGYRIAFDGIDDVSGLSLGATVRFAQRFKITTGEDMKSVDELAVAFGSLEQNIYQAGSISSDFGASLRLQNFIFGVAVRDAFSTEFAWKSMKGEGTLSSTKIPMSVDFGASYRFYFNNNFIQEVGVYVEFENATCEYTSWGSKLRLGSELKLFNFLDARVGMYNQFITGGIGMGWKWFRIDAAYYREKYLDYFTSDQYYLNMTFGLDNSPQRKSKSIQKQLDQDRIQAQNIEFINDSLAGL